MRFMVGDDYYLYRIVVNFLECFINGGGKNSMRLFEREYTLKACYAIYVLCNCFYGV